MDFNPQSFRQAFDRFQKLVLIYSGHPFTSLNEGLVEGWERYKRPNEVRCHELGQGQYRPRPDS